MTFISFLGRFSRPLDYLGAAAVPFWASHCSDIGLIVVSGRIDSIIDGISVAALLSGTENMKLSPVSQLTPQKATAVTAACSCDFYVL